MVRSLYSGVAGMKVHQARMDVIGNNISNVNTYGFKASRATFSDLYYQTLTGASGASASSGGTNPSQIGYGVQFSGVDLLIDRAAFTSTDRSLDVAIAGDGFFQVQDAEGNIFYSRAGNLQIDTDGNLVDGNGNFILGISGGSLGKAASSDKIRFAIPTITPTAAKAVETINGKIFTITAANKTESGNVVFNFTSDDTLPGGQKVKAEVSASGISIILNANEKFYTMSELNTEINKAITEANGGVTHPAGMFTITTEPANVFPGTSAIKGAITATIENTAGGIAGFPTTGIFGGMTYEGVSRNFSGSGASGEVTFTADFVAGNPAATDDAKFDRWLITANVHGTNFTGYVLGNAPQTVYLTNGTAGSMQYIKMTAPGVSAMQAAATAVGTPATDWEFTDISSGITASASEFLMGGLQYATVSQPFSASGAATMSGRYVAANTAAVPPTSEGWEITATIGSIAYTGIVSSKQAETVRLYNADRSEYIELRHQGVDSMSEAAGYPQLSPSSAAVPFNTAMPASAITGSSMIATPSSPFIGSGLTGAEIVSNDFATQPGVMSGIDRDDGVLGGLQFMTTSTDFRISGDSAPVAFSAVYLLADPATSRPEGWQITATVGTGADAVNYVGYVSTSMTSANSLLLKNLDGAYIQMSHPGITAMNEAFGTATPSDGAMMTPPTETITITGAEPSQALGLSSKSIALGGGTVGGVQSLADISNISIGPDGIIEATHSILGRLQLGQICLATFDNPQGLEQAGNTYFVETANSGKAKVTTPGASGTGTLVTSALEMSNVDLSKEFTEMITTQRGFQANSRIITVSDTLLEELINLKR